MIAILDDKAARRAAAALGVPVIGTLGILAAATRMGHLRSFESALEQVVHAGLYVNPAVVSEIAAGLRTGGCSN